MLLAEAVGVRRAREMSFTGNFVDAEEALRWGLVNHVVPHDELLPFCPRLAADIAGDDRAACAGSAPTYGEIADAVAAGELGRRGRSRPRRGRADSTPPRSSAAARRSATRGREQASR